MLRNSKRLLIPLARACLHSFVRDASCLLHPSFRASHFYVPRMHDEYEIIHFTIAIGYGVFIQREVTLITFPTGKKLGIAGASHAWIQD